MRALAISAFLAGLLLGVRVMFFGVRRVVGDDDLRHRRWPLALAALLMVSGALLYARARTGSGDGVTAAWGALVVLAGLVAGAAAWWLVKRSAATPSADPDDDPRYRFQGQVARVIEALGSTDGSRNVGRIAFDFDGKRHVHDARWSEDGGGAGGHDPGVVDSEVVIERIEHDVAYVEPWAAVEGRL